VGGKIMKDESDYVKQLRKFIYEIQTKITRSGSVAGEVLNEAGKLECPDKKERNLLNELISRAIEYIELEKIIKQQKYTMAQFEAYLTQLRWFNSVRMLIETFDVPLSEISFNSMSLKEES
jgi:hypothetical protein